MVFTEVYNFAVTFANKNTKMFSARNHESTRIHTLKSIEKFSSRGMCANYLHTTPLKGYRPDQNILLGYFWILSHSSLSYNQTNPVQYKVHLFIIQALSLELNWLPVKLMFLHDVLGYRNET